MSKVSERLRDPLEPCPTTTRERAADLLDECEKLIRDLAEAGVGGSGQLLGMKYGREDARATLAKLEGGK